MLRHYERVLWLDADVVVTDPEIRLDDFNALRIHFSRDWGEDAIDDSHFSSGAYLVHDTQACVVAEALAQDQFRDSAFGDQDAFRFVYKNPPLPLSLFHIHPRRKFNAVHPEIGPSVIEPWQPGDFLCHLTMVPIKKRIELAKRLTSI